MSDGIDVAPDGSLSCAYCGGPISTGSPPEVKVTEVVGRLEMWERKGGGTASAIATPVGVAGPVKFLETLLPESAHSKWDGATMYGPYGRFRITVEFTPEEG